jgi:hypothetical protein
MVDGCPHLSAGAECLLRGDLPSTTEEDEPAIVRRRYRDYLEHRVPVPGAVAAKLCAGCQVTKRDFCGPGGSRQRRATGVTCRLGTWQERDARAGGSVQPGRVDAEVAGVVCGTAPVVNVDGLPIWDANDEFDGSLLLRCRRQAWIGRMAWCERGA